MAAFRLPTHDKILHEHYLSGVREVERWPRNHKVPSLIPWSGCQLRAFHWPNIRHEYWCGSQEAESREINISCKNLFLNRCGRSINIFKLKEKKTLSLFLGV